MLLVPDFAPAVPLGVAAGGPATTVTAVMVDWPPPGSVVVWRNTLVCEDCGAADEDCEAGAVVDWDAAAVDGEAPGEPEG